MRIATTLKRISMKRRASWLFTGLPLGAVTAWLILANLGCLTWDTFWAFEVTFNPVCFVMEAGKSGTVEATLWWSDTKTLEAKTWTVEKVPNVLASATCSHPVDSDSTTVSMQCGTDPSLFGATELWTASAANSYQLGVKATFVDPVWKSLSEGQEVVLARRGYLPLRGGLSQVVISQTEQSYWQAKYRIEVLNPFEGWRYTYTGYYKWLPPGESQVVDRGEFSETKIDTSGYQAVYYPGAGKGTKVLVVFTVKQRDGSGKVVRTEDRSFRFTL